MNTPHKETMHSFSHREVVNIRARKSISTTINMSKYYILAGYDKMVEKWE